MTTALLALAMLAAAGDPYPFKTAGDHERKRQHGAAQEAKKWKASDRAKLASGEPVLTVKAQVAAAFS